MKGFQSFIYLSYSAKFQDNLNPSHMELHSYRENHVSSSGITEVNIWHLLKILLVFCKCPFHFSN